MFEPYCAATTLPACKPMLPKDLSVMSPPHIGGSTVALHHCTGRPEYQVTAQACLLAIIRNTVECIQKRDRDKRKHAVYQRCTSYVVLHLRFNLGFIGLYTLPVLCTHIATATYNS
jgi:hypothetical protein